MKDIDYRTEVDEKGVRHYFVKAEGQWVEVEKAVYLVFAWDDRKKRRKERERREAGIQFVSLDKMVDDYYSEDAKGAKTPIVLQSASAEEDYFDLEQSTDDNAFLEWFQRRYPKMPLDRRVFFMALDELRYSGRALAEKMNMPSSTMHYQLKRLYEEIAEQFRSEGARK